jgi:flagellar biosynthesis/type III secretory pathway chaperone
MPELSTTRLADLVSKRRRCLEQLLELGKRQADFIAVGNMSDLMRLLSAKQQLIVALQGLEKQLTPYHDEHPESRRWSSPEERMRCAADADHCRRLIADVMAMEQAGERQLTLRRDETAVQLRNVGAAGRVREAYQSQK